MLRYETLFGKWPLVVLIGITLLGATALASIHPQSRQVVTETQQAHADAAPTPTERALAFTQAAIVAPNSTPVPEPSATPSPEPEPTQTATAQATPTIAPAPPKPSNTPVVMETAIAKALQPTPDPAILPNGVHYGERTPNLPHRIVRIASPDIKLDTRVYEVYGAPDGTWEVADYAAGHHFNSKNPGEGGNIVLSGHNNWRGEVFRYLEFLKPGNTINLWTLEGKEYTYKVQTIEKLKEAGTTRAERLAHGKVMDATPNEQLTLITCWPYTTFTHRLIVIATPVQ